MSSSEDEYFDASPDVVVRKVGTRTKKSSPKKVPKKKQREVLSDFNVGLDDDGSDDSFNDSEEESVPENRSRHRGSTAVGNTSSKSGSMSVSTHGDGHGRSGSSRSGGTENRPPTSTPRPVEQQGDDGQGSSVAPRARARNRLSIRSSEPGNRRSSISSTATSASGAENMESATEVRNIYETCSQMFNTNRINPQNAFSLRLLDCINQMINSPNYDKSNMHLTSSTVEIGTKIYVCRVDNTHSQVLSLASDISLQQRRNQNNGPANGEGNENAAGMDVDGEFDDEGDRGERQRQKKKVSKRRGRYVEQDNAKLLTGLEEQNVKFVTRRNFLEKKFNDMIYDDLDFDYLSYFLEAEDVHPLQTEKEKDDIKNPLTIADAYANAHEMSRLDFFPFHHLPKFDPDTHDIWGRPLKAAENLRDETMADPLLPMNAEFAYDPANRPAEYPDEAPPDDFMHDSGGEGDNGFGDEAVDVPQVSFHDIRTLDNLDEYFQRVRSLLKDNKSKYGWCGPNFVRPKSTWPVNRIGAKKNKLRKEPKRIDFETLDWSDKLNKFNVNHQSGRTIFDDRIIESWSGQKVIIPFLGMELTSYDDEFDPLDFQNEIDPKFVPPIFRLFTSKNRSILDLLKARNRARQQSGASLDGAPDLGGDDGFDIELPRDIAEDFCSQPMNEDGFQPFGSTPAEAEAGWQFPATLPGLLNDDPLSLASEIDSIRFSRKPKPIDMNILKKSILKTLTEKLDLDENGMPLKDEETTVGLADLMFLVLKKIGERTEKLMSVPIFIVALMHVVADNRLFVIYDDSDPDCPVVICRGRLFDHAKHIPMPDGNFE